MKVLNTSGAVPFEEQFLDNGESVHYYNNGCFTFCKGDLRHNKDGGPAVVHSTRYREWWVKGKLTKIEYSDGSLWKPKKKFFINIF